MRSMTFVRNDGSRVQIEVPKGMNGPFLMRQMQRLNRGLPVTGVTESEMEWMADVVASLSDREPAKAAHG